MAIAGCYAVNELINMLHFERFDVNVLKKMVNYCRDSQLITEVLV